jgi:hypothetical protein
MGEQQSPAEEITPAASGQQPQPPPWRHHYTHPALTAGGPMNGVRSTEPDPPRPSPAHIAPRHPRSEKSPETPEQAAERQKRINDLLGYENPSPRRRWRRRFA